MAQNAMVMANVTDNAVVANVKEEVTMNNMTVKQLQAQAKEMGIAGYSKMKKADLVVAIKAREQAKRDSKVKSDYQMFPGDDISDIEMEKCLIPVGLAPIPVVEQSAPVEVPVGFVPVGTPTTQVQEKKVKKTPVQQNDVTATAARNGKERLYMVEKALIEAGYNSKKKGFGFTVNRLYLRYIIYSTYGWKSGKWALENGKITEEQRDNAETIIEYLRAQGKLVPAVGTSLRNNKGMVFFGKEYNGYNRDKMTAVKPEQQKAFLKINDRKPWEKAWNEETGEGTTSEINTWRIHLEKEAAELRRQH